MSENILSRIVRRSTLLVAVTAALAAPVQSLHAQWVTTAEQFYPGGSFNWRFLSTYPDAAKLFNAFDYGHAILYEVLWRSRLRRPFLVSKSVSSTFW